MKISAWLHVEGFCWVICYKTKPKTLEVVEIRVTVVGGVGTSNASLDQSEVDAKQDISTQNIIFAGS